MKRDPRVLQAGFSFVELSFVILILGMISALVVQVTGAMKRAASTAAAARQLEAVNNSLVAFAAIHGRLPCADANRDGHENRTGSGACVVVGTLPYLTLGQTSPLLNVDGLPLKYALYHRDDAVLRKKANLGDRAERYRPSVGVPTSATDLTVQLEDKAFAAWGGRTLNQRLDFCQGVRAALDAGFDDRYLYVEKDGAKQHVAYVLVDPGAGNADLLDDEFDGLNSAASDALPRFEHPNRSQSRFYDDRVRVAYLDSFWEELGCSGAMATAGRAHPNVETMLALFNQSQVDYLKQLELAVDMAYANNFLAGAAIASATSGVLSSSASAVVATSSAINSAGVTTGAVVSSAASVVLNAAALGVAIGNQVFTVQSYNDAKKYRDDFKAFVSDRFNPLYTTVQDHVARSGHLIYSDE
jgi:type II secretory pathway pseudopilin PulG